MAEEKIYKWGGPRYSGINFILYLCPLGLLTVFKSFVALCCDNSEILKVVKAQKDLSGV